MKKGIAISFGSLIFSIASAASATVAYSTSVKYVDEGGAVVGQTITFCSSASYAGGNVHTAYHIS